MARRGISLAAIEPAVVTSFAFALITSSQGRATDTPRPLRNVRRGMRHLWLLKFMMIFGEGYLVWKKVLATVAWMISCKR